MPDPDLSNLRAVIADDRAVPGSDTPDQVADLVTRFSHDVASPLTCVLALSGLLVREAQTSDRVSDDLKRIRAAAEEIAAMVRALSEGLASSGRDRRTGSS